MTKRTNDRRKGRAIADLASPLFLLFASFIVGLTVGLILGRALL